MIRFAFLKLSAACVALPALLAFSGAAIAHHSFEGVYKPGDTFEVTGTIANVRFVNPHATFDVDVPDDKGGNVRYRFELHSLVEMLRVPGWKRDTLKVGTKIKVSATRARASRIRGFVAWVQFPDGRKLSTWGTE